MHGKGRRLDVWCEDTQISVLISKKGKVTIKEHAGTKTPLLTLSHNRKKQYILPENETVPFLVELGVQTQAGKLIDKKRKKFKQINRFLEMIRDIEDELPVNQTVNIIDFGCGKSYLTFAVYHYLHRIKKRDVRIVGLDLKKDVIDHCNRLSEKFGYEGLTFCHGDIESYTGVDTVDMVMTLHACDTATDFALQKAVCWGAKVILSVPCCQHEINGQMDSSLLAPVMKYGIIKERMSALVTDAIRANLLEENGYDVQILEFIEMEHTPKNLLIRAVKKKEKRGRTKEYIKMCEEMHIEPMLEKLLRDK